uniref:RING-type domain-containing protein n=1 Tax=viral metagenome TaxID=1070528 RepID=A0A6C0JH32_9ZZZZ
MKITYKNITKYNKKTLKKRKTKNKVKKRKTKNTNKKRKITYGGTQEYDDGTQKYERCSICFGTFYELPITLPVITLSCYHKFHRNCIDEWCKTLLHNATTNTTPPCTCPLCRTNLITDEDKKNFEIPPKCKDIDKFGAYINRKLNDYTNKPLEKLEDLLSSFLRTDSLPEKCLLDNKAMKFVLSLKAKLYVPDDNLLGRYRFDRILDLPLQDERGNDDELGNDKYFQFKSILDPEKDKIIAYQLDEVKISK